MVRQHRLLAVVLAVISALGAAIVFSPWAAGAGLVVGVGYYWWSLRKYRRRARVLAAPFPDEWRDLLEQRCPFYTRLDEPGRRRFENDVRIFLAEQRVYGIRGVRVEDDIRLLVAASAAMLSHGLPDWEWSRARDVVVYPAAFNEDYDMEDDPHISGMVHKQGPVLVSRPSLELGFRHPTDGHNVALHELAHVMDFADGYADGVPAGATWHATAPWVKLVAERLEQVREEGHPVLRRYAGVNEAELFAVAVEVFFERPARLREKDPELYELLAGFFAIDPDDPSQRRAQTT